MEPTPPESSAPTRLVMPPLLDALEAWQVAPAPDTLASVRDRLRDVGQHLGLEIGRVRAVAPPLPELVLDLGAHDATDQDLHAPGANEPIGSIAVAGDPTQARSLVRAVEVALAATRVSARALRAERQLAALDQAVRGIGGVLDIERVLQLIVDRVRELVDARYAAIGIVDASGAIERFITSGISDEQRARIGPLPRGHGLLGLIIRENRSYRVADIAAHPESHGFPPHHPPMTSFLGTPIRTQGGTIGRLYLTDKVGSVEFSEADQSLVEMFALHAGIAMENARLHDQVRRLAVVDERDRISRDMHDSVIQAIYAQTLALEDIQDLVDEDRGAARERIDEVIDALHAVIRDIRNFIFGLRPVLLESGSLSEGLRHLATELHRNGGVEVDLDIASPVEAVDQLPIETVAELLAIAREGLSNVARHAGASTAWVGLAWSGDHLRLELRDDGRGFVAREQPGRGHHGLANMTARADALGGTFVVRSARGSGTRIIVTIPIRADTDGGDA